MENTFVNRNLIHKIADLCLDVQAAGHYCSATIGNHGFLISVCVILNGFDSREHGYDFHWHISDNGEKEDAQEAVECVYTLEEILKEARNNDAV